MLIMCCFCSLETGTLTLNLNLKSMSSRSSSSNMGLLDNNNETKSISQAPPRILSIVSSALEKVVHKNEKLLKSSKKKDKVTSFHGSRAPALNIYRYLECIFKYTDASPSSFVVLYIYIERYLHHQKDAFFLTSLAIHRLVITAFVLAAKYLEDECYNNAYYAKVGGVSTTELNKLEMEFLIAVDFRLHVDVESFDKYCLKLEEEAREKCQIQRPIKICGIGRRWLTATNTQPNHSPSIAGYTCRAM